MGWQLVQHSFVLLFRNLVDALKVSVGPTVIGIAAVLAVLWALGLPLSALQMQPGGQMMGQMDREMAGAVLTGSLFALLVVVLVSSWVAVSWHRFVLLEEYPGLLPALSGRPILGYLGRVILLTLVMILIAIPLGFVAGLVIMPFMGGGGAKNVIIIGAIYAIVIGAILSWFWLRFGLVLPARAIGKPMGMGDSWRATGRLSGAILGATLILMVINFGAGLVVDLLFGATTLATILNIAVSWVSLMLGISILTTLYGHLVEGRSID